jgi:hypothetical protein
VTQVLHVLALVVALLGLPTVAALVAWGLVGGDGEPARPALGLLGAVVALGSVYVVATCWTAFWGLPAWRWWLMLVPAAAAGVGLAALPSRATRTTDRLRGLGLAASLAVPALLLWLAGAVTPI